MTPSESDAAVFDSLCDALARGRLCLAELALLDPPELEAMYGIGVGRIETGRIDEAVVILQALVSLYGYSAKYWRGLGLALHASRRAEAAMLAYRLALHLEPDHIPTVGWLGELKLFSGLPEEAHPLLERAAHSNHPRAAPRARQLLGAPMAPPLPDAHPPPMPGPPPLPRDDDAFGVDADTFERTGGGPLPMPHTGTNTAPLAFPEARELTDKIFLADQEEGGAPGPITQTAIIRRPGGPRPLGREASGTDTGLVDRALAEVDVPAHIGAARDFVRWFATAARRRRSALPLLDEETAPMGDRRPQR